jgi:hypothetical protein
MIEVVEDHLMNMQEFLKNRGDFPLAELAKHRGEWVAWSPDGTRLVAASRFTPYTTPPLVASSAV